VLSGKKRWLALLALLAVAGVGVFFGAQDSEPGPEKVPFSEVLTKVNEDQVESLEIDNARKSVLAQGKSQDWQSGIPSEPELNALIKAAENQEVSVSANPLPDTKPSLLERIGRLIPTLLTIAIIVLIAHYLGVFKSNFAQEAEIPDDIDFSDVAGVGEAVEELREIETFLKDPGRYERLGASAPRGVLLYGPPGTGKTLLARAMAAEAQVPFYSTSGSSFVEMFAGMGAQRVRSLFARAAKTAPAIIFIDELDAVGMKRSNQPGDSAMREGDQTLVEILKQMDGFNKSDQPVIVIGATNRIDSLDPALVRPGRFDRHISVDAPDRQGRLEILKVHAKNKRIKADLGPLATQTAGMTGADLALILNEAALIAARHDSEAITDRHLSDAFLRVVAGAEKQNRAISEEERNRIAVHEAGHAVVRELLDGADQVHKISIIPRGQSGGQTIMVSEQDVFLYSPQDIRNRIAALLAGRAAEKILLGEVSSGAADDLQQATALGESYSTHLGMGQALGLRVADRPSGSDRDRVNKEISELLEAEYQRALALCQEHRPWIDAIVAVLHDKETIDRDEFLTLGPKSA
jgi:cell division protease FtsH